MIVFDLTQISIQQGQFIFNALDGAGFSAFGCMVPGPQPKAIEVYNLRELPEAAMRKVEVIVAQATHMLGPHDGDGGEGPRNAGGGL